MTFTEEVKDITTIDKAKYLVAHCIAADLNWGGGIAPVIIRGMYNAETKCRYKCTTAPDGCTTSLSAGGLFVVQTDVGTFANLITKTNTWDRPTYDTITNSLLELKNYMVHNKLNKLCIPRIGCGIDRLSWNVVSNIIKGIFCDTDITIDVVYKE